MEIIQPSLGNNLHPLGIRSSLSNPDRMLLKKESHFLNSQSNFISPIQTKPPLITSSKFFLSRKYESSTQPLIGWDTQDINSEFSLLELDSFDSIAPPENNNINNSKSVKSSIPEILPNHIGNDTSDDTSQEINIKGKSKSKKTNKSQKPPEKKSKPKSKTTKTVKSATAKNVAQFVDKNNITINRNEDGLLTSDEPVSVETNSENLTLRLDIASDNTTNNNDFSSITPSIMASASPIVEDKSISFRNIANDSLQENFQITSNLPNVDSSAKERIIPLQEKIELDNTGELLENSPLEFTSDNSVRLSPTLTSADVEDKLDSVASDENTLITNITATNSESLVDLSPKLISPDVDDKLHSVASDQNTFITNIAAINSESLVDLSPKLISPGVDDKLHSVASDQNTLITNIAATNSESLVDLSPKLISPDVDNKLHSVASDQNTLITNITATNSESLVDLSPKLTSPDVANTVASDENTLITNIAATNSEFSVDLSPKLTSPNVDDKLHSVANDQNTLITSITATNSESLVDLSPKLISPNIENIVVSDENPLITNIAATNSESLVDLSPKLISPNIENIVVSDENPLITNIAATNSESLVDLSPKLISPNIENIVVSDENPLITNIAATNSESLVDLSPKLISPDVDDKLDSVANDQNPLITNITATNSESSIDLSPTLTLSNVENTVASDENILITNITATNSESSVDLSPKLISPNVDDKLHSVANDENTLIANITATNSESLVDLSPKLISPNVDDKLHSVANDENTLIANITATNSESLVDLSPKLISPNVDDKLHSVANDENTLITNITATNSESLVAENVSDVLANVTSLQRNSNVENTTSQSIENQSILVLPEIVKETSLPTKSPEMGEALLTTTSPDIIETASIFRKIIDNEQTIELKSPSAVTNPEILTFVDTSDSPTSPQNEVSTLAEVEQNAIAKNFPAPKGYATGGHVTDSPVENRQQIAPSDIVPAMLTPGEFVINTRDAQKNLPLLHHINTGGTPQDIILPSLQTPNPQEPEEKTSLETPTKVDSFSDTSLQLQSAETDSPQISNSLIPSSLGLNTGKHQLSSLNSPQLNTLQNETIDVSESSPQYSSPPMIFRKANPTANTSSQWSNTPSQWSSVEDLLNVNNDEFTSFNFNGVESRDSQNSEFSDVSESPQIFAKHLPSPRGFANGGEVAPPDISREIEPITETIESASSPSEGGKKDDTADLEALAREIYNRLRQRIEIERERHGGSSGRLPW